MILSARTILSNTFPVTYVLGNIAPLGPRYCPRALPLGNLLGFWVQNPRPQEISRSLGDVFPNVIPPLGIVRIADTL